MLSICLAIIDNPSDKEKFTQIYYAYKDHMFGVAMKILHNSALAEEAVQDSFFKLAKIISDISDPICSKTAALVVIIVRNTSYDCLRKEKLGSTLPFDETIETMSPIKMPDIEDVLSGGVGDVMDIISGMDKHYSDVLKLKYIYGYSNGEIAELLNVSAKNVGVRIYRAKLKLKTKLKERDYEIE